MKVREPVGIVPIVLTPQQATTLMLSAAIETAIGYAERVFLATLTPPAMPRRDAAQWVDRIIISHVNDMKAEAAKVADELDLDPVRRQHFEQSRAVLFCQRLIELQAMASGHRGSA